MHQPVYPAPDTESLIARGYTVSVWKTVRSCFIAPAETCGWLFVTEQPLRRWQKAGCSSYIEASLPKLTVIYCETRICEVDPTSLPSFKSSGDVPWRSAFHAHLQKAFQSEDTEEADELFERAQSRYHAQFALACLLVEMCLVDKVPTLSATVKDRLRWDDLGQMFLETLELAQAARVAASQLELVL